MTNSTDHVWTTTGCQWSPRQSHETLAVEYRCVHCDLTQCAAAHLPPLPEGPCPARAMPKEAR